MRRVTAVFLLLLALAALMPVSAAAQDLPVSVSFDGQPVSFEVPPIIRDGRTFVPVRFVLERIQAGITWDGEARRVTIVDGPVTVILTIGDQTALVNGVRQRLDVAPFIYRDRTMVPLRFVGETFGFFVHYDAATQTVQLAPPATPPAASAADGTVEVVAPASVRAGSSFVVGVRFKGVSHVAGAGLILAFDPEQVQAVQILSGRLVEGLSPGKRFDNRAGTVTYQTAALGTQSFSGDGTYFEVAFRAVQPGLARFELRSGTPEGAPLVSSDLKLLNPALVHGVTTITE